MRKLTAMALALGGTLLSASALAEPARPAPAAAPEAEEVAPSEAAGPGRDMPEDAAGFAAAMREQIAAVGGTAECEAQAGRCRYRHGSGAEARDVHLWYSGQSRTIYVFASWISVAGRGDAATPTVLRHLAAINRILEVTRFEWNPESGEVRLSAVVNVDTNLDRRALAGVLRAVEDGVDRYGPAIRRLAQAHERAPAPPRPPARDESRPVADTSGYMAAIEDELGRLGLRPTCDATRGRCSYELDSTAARNIFSFVVRYDPSTATVAIFADRYLSAARDNPRTDPLLQRLLELNWEQLVPMFQWDAGNGDVRLAGVMNVDGNFDRRAFRGVVQSVHAAAERHFRALRTVLNP